MNVDAKKSNNYDQISLTQDEYGRVGVMEAGIESLSPELLNDILSRLEPEDILRVQQVSRHLNNASHARSIWLALVKGSQMRYLVEKRFELYTAQELEDLVRHKLRRDAHWASNSKPLAVYNFGMDEESSFAGFHILVPGGRWFITMDLHGGIYYEDLLDVDDPCGGSIAEGIDPDTFEALGAFLCMEMLESTEYLAFHLLSVGRRTWELEKDEHLFPSECDAAHHIQMFYVSVEFDDYGTISGLKSERLSSFFEDGNLGFYNVSFCGNVLAYHSINPTCCILIDWKEANGRLLEHTRRRLRTNTKMSTLLSETILCAWTQQEILVYDLASMDLPFFMDPPTGKDIEFDKPTWSLKYPCPINFKLERRTPPILTDNSILLLFSLSDGILKLTVPKSLSDEPSLVVLPTQSDIVHSDLHPAKDPGCRRQLQPDGGAEYCNKQIIAYRYNKAEDGTIMSISSSTRPISFRDANIRNAALHLDGYSGRIFLSSDADSHYIVDLEECSE
ncbi:hypothetical protein BDN70DRAFT_91099 [Pholiota conissans]|uniref:F-box domain-containing protein n=1 Tax=Pholiota conissans TaxID=109636 RepID=A0A9P6CZM1_9AGAR|nr:hypothetical protein BDN70DRAFT_91099 [Pholiota conissans]